MAQKTQQGLMKNQPVKLQDLKKNAIAPSKVSPPLLLIGVRQ